MVYYNKTKQTLNQVASSQVILLSVCQYTQKNLMVLPALEPLLYLPRRCQRLETQQAAAMLRDEHEHGMRFKKGYDFFSCNFSEVKLFHTRRQLETKPRTAQGVEERPISIEQQTLVNLSALH